MKFIFIISQPRSGSTLLQNLLSNNHCVDTCPESWFFLLMLSYYLEIEAEYDHTLAKDSFAEFVNNGIGLEDFRNHLSVFSKQVFRGNSKAKFFVEKTPRNYYIVDELRKVFPNDFFVFHWRNPVKVLSSIISTWKLKSPYDLYPFRNDIFDAPKLINEYKNNIERGKTVRHVCYEDIISDPSRTVSELYEWLGIAYSESVLDFRKNEKTIGKRGDKKILKHLQIGETPDFYNEIVSHKHWRIFFEGYSEYLESVLRFPNQTPRTKSSLFNDFLKFCDLRIPDKSVINPNVLKSKVSYHLNKIKYDYFT